MFMLRRAVIPRAALAPRVVMPAVATRGFASSSPELPADPEAAAEFRAERAHSEEHAGQSAETWRKISYFGMIPLCAALGVYIYQIEAKHHEHHEHVLEENDGNLPERPPYPYLNLRPRPFPWGNQSLFFNPKVNYPAGEE